jgi:hypothetical protein
MLWQKSWIETRWRFLIGFGILLVLACGIVMQYPAARSLLPSLASVRVGEPNGRIARAIQNAIDTQRDYRGFVWYQWVDQTFSHIWILFAALLGSGGLIARSTGAGMLFTLSLPVRRRDLVGIRAATGLAELFALALVPSLLIALLSPSIGEHYSLVDAFVHGVCVFVGGALFYCLALLLSTVFSDIWRPSLIACAAAVVIAGCEAMVADGSRFGIFGALTAESYFRTGSLPWPGLLASASASAALLYGTVLNVNQLEV